MTLPVTYVRSLWAPPHPSLQDRFDQWLATEDGQAVYTNVRDRALALRRRGWRHYGIAALVEAARYDAALVVGPDEPWRINNSYRSRLARRLMSDHPELAGFFETRRVSA